jgi:hypothetical protein
MFHTPHSPPYASDACFLKLSLAIPMASIVLDLPVLPFNSQCVTNRMLYSGDDFKGAW